jgi:hypothetical protein
MATATFAEFSHSYEVDGIVVPSVTQVLSLTGIDDVSGIPLHYLQRAAGIGTAVHQACELLDEDDLDLESLDPLIQGYVLGYQRFREETGFAVDLVEHRRIADVDGFRYGMCVDRVGSLDGRPTVIDIKTASRKQHSWQIQTAAYSVGLADQIDYPGTARAVVHVAKDGSYKLLRHEDQADFDVWWAALRTAYWLLGHGKKIA